MIAVDSSVLIDVLIGDATFGGEDLLGGRGHVLATKMPALAPNGPACRRFTPVYAAWTEPNRFLTIGAAMGRLRGEIG